MGDVCLLVAEANLESGITGQNQQSETKRSGKLMDVIDQRRTDPLPSRFRMNDKQTDQAGGAVASGQSEWGEAQAGRGRGRSRPPQTPASTHL